MNKKNKSIILFVILSAVVVFVYFLYFSKKDSIPFSSAKMLEGEIVSLEKDKVLIKDSTLEFDFSDMSEKPSKTIEFYIYKKLEVEEYLAEFCSEKEMLETEKEYENWQKIPEEEKDIFSVLLPPSWNKSKKINFSELEQGDHVRVIYFDSNEKKTIVKIIKNVEENSNISENENIKEFSFSAQVVEVSETVLKVKNTSSISGIHQEGTAIEVLLDEKTKFKQLKAKSTEAFQEEENRFISEKQKIKEAGGDYLSLEAPSRFQELDIDKSDIKLATEVTVDANYDGKNLKAITIQQIIK